MAGLSQSTYTGSPDDPKTAALVSYITFIGWLFSYAFLYPEKKTEYSRFHLRQSLLIHIFSLLLKIAFSFNMPPRTGPDIVVIVLAVLLFITWLTGFWDAIQGRMRPVFLIGSLAQSLFRRL